MYVAVTSWDRGLGSMHDRSRGLHVTLDLMPLHGSGVDSTSS